MNTARKRKDWTRQGGFAGSSRQGTRSEAGPRLLCLAGRIWNRSFDGLGNQRDEFRKPFVRHTIDGSRLCRRDRPNPIGCRD